MIDDDGFFSAFILVGAKSRPNMNTLTFGDCVYRERREKFVLRRLQYRQTLQRRMTHFNHLGHTR